MIDRKNTTTKRIHPILVICFLVISLIFMMIFIISLLYLGVSTSLHWDRLWWCVPILGYELWIFMDQTKEETLKDNFVLYAFGILNCIILMIFDKEMFEFLVDSFVEDYYRYFK